MKQQLVLLVGCELHIAPNVLQLRLTALESVRFKPLSVDAVRCSIF